ncbi:HEAT repeat domain-containing protein [Candidatus Binatia bacterium]|nr:HEAT repeat domain-containing protein [Candidatus Binatia bacterium]
MMRSQSARCPVAVGLVLVGLLGTGAAQGQVPVDTKHGPAILGAWQSAVPAERLALMAALLDDRANATLALRAAVVAGDAPTRAAACRLLGEMRDRASLPALLAATHDAEPAVQAHAVTALRILRDPAAAPRLRELVRGAADRAVLKRAMAALAEVGADADQVIVRSRLTDPDISVRVIAAGSLAMLGSPEAEAVLLAAIDGDDARAQKNATYALGFVGTATARARLADILADPRGRWKSYAAMGMAQMDAAVQTPAAQAAAFERLARGTDRIVAHWAMDRLADTPGPEADAALERLAGRSGRAGQRAVVRLRTRGGR